jgi:hypothetical protein
MVSAGWLLVKDGDAAVGRLADDLRRSAANLEGVVQPYGSCHHIHTFTVCLSFPEDSRPWTLRFHVTASPVILDASSRSLQAKKLSIPFSAFGHSLILFFFRPSFQRDFGHTGVCVPLYDIF